MTPEQMDNALLRAIAAGRRGPMAKVAPSDRRILAAALAEAEQRRVARLSGAPTDSTEERT